MLLLLGGGYSTAYAPDVAEHVRDTREHVFHQLRPSMTRCLVALNEDHLDKYVIVVFPMKGRAELCHVIDVAKKEHLAERMRHRYIIEVDAMTHAHMGHGPVWLFGGIQ